MRHRQIPSDLVLRRGHVPAESVGDVPVRGYLRLVLASYAIPRRSGIRSSPGAGERGMARGRRRTSLVRSHSRRGRLPRGAIRPSRLPNSAMQRPVVGLPGAKEDRVPRALLEQEVGLDRLARGMDVLNMRNVPVGAAPFSRRRRGDKRRRSRPSAPPSRRSSAGFSQQLETWCPSGRRRGDASPVAERRATGATLGSPLDFGAQPLRPGRYTGTLTPGRERRAGTSASPGAT